MKTIISLIILGLLCLNKTAGQNTLHKPYDLRIDTTYSLTDYQIDYQEVSADSQAVSKSIRIRPYKYSPTSLDGPPVVVIDGKVSQQGFDGLSPNAVESLTVLKGEKAKSLYGEGSVIIVTTKKGAMIKKIE